MQFASKLIGQAVSETAAAVERAQRFESMAVGHIAKATSLVMQSAGAMVGGVLSADDAAAAQRGLGMIGIAAGKLLASKAATILAEAGKLNGAVSTAKKALGAASDIFNGAKKLPAVETALIRRQRTALPSISPKAAGGTSHLLILHADNGETFYFNLSTAAYSTLKRSSDYSVASQERLTRRPALQAVARGGETITLPGVIWTAGKPGAGQLTKLRGIGFAQDPVMLTTGYGEVLGRWYLTKVDEEQDGLMSDGAPRKQTFTLEFSRYGDDFTNI